MINGHNAHKKGGDILSSGVKADLLPANSLAVEISLENNAKDQQFAANKKMVAESTGLLAEVHGSERFLTLANSHFIQWDKAMDAGCKGPDGSPLIVTPDMKPLLRDGWGWKIIRAEAEKTWPNLPSFASMAMNSHNSNQIATNELECMMQLADLYQAGMKMDDAIMAVQASAPACKAYLQDVAYFCKMFGGGSTFPLLKCLDHFCTWAFLSTVVCVLVSFFCLLGDTYVLCFLLPQSSSGKTSGHSLLVVEEMMNHLSYFDFRITGHSMALTRVAIAATILTSKKSQDGISKLIYKSDFDKLRAKEATMKLDETLTSLWAEAQRVDKDLGYPAFGKACCNMVLHLLQKQKLAKRETFESFEDIMKDFENNLVGGATGANLSQQPAQTQSQPSEPSAVKDLVNRTPVEVAKLQNSHIKAGDRCLACTLFVFCHGFTVTNLCSITCTQKTFCFGTPTSLQVFSS